MGDSSSGVSGSQLYEEILPLCKGLSEEKNGTLTLRSIEPYESLKSRLEGVFSIVLYYYGSKDNFLREVYMKGIHHMLTILHTIKRRFNNWGLVIYTDRKTRPLLESVFPFEKYPRLCLVEVNWPMYTNSQGNIDGTILRCLRFQVVDLFPEQLCLIRDADTLFPRLLGGTSIDNMEITRALAIWENHFIDRWLKKIQEAPLIVIGTHYLDSTGTMYKQNWHRNVPFALALPFEVERRDPYMHLKYPANVAFGAKHGSSLIGVFAGFVNIRNEDGVLNNMWRQCVDYLQQRFFMVRLPKMIPTYGGVLAISDSYSDRYYGASVGKDEKCILFVMSRFYLDTIYYFDLHYFTENEPRTAEHPVYTIEVLGENKGNGAGKQVQFERKMIPKLVFSPDPNGSIPYSILLNPVAIDMVLDEALIVQNAWTKSPTVYRYYEFFKEKMALTMAQYEEWLKTYNKEAIQAEIGSEVMAYVEKTPKYKKLIEGEVDNGFLKQAQIFSTDVMEDQIWKEAVAARKAAREAATATVTTNKVPGSAGGRRSRVHTRKVRRRRNGRTRRHY